MVQGEINRGRHTDRLSRLGATPSGLTIKRYTNLRILYFTLKMFYVLPNMNHTQTAEKAKNAVLSLVTLTFDLDLQTRPSEGPSMSFL